MTNEDKLKLVEQLTALATEGTNAWSARLYLAAALWLETELKQAGVQRDGLFLTIAAERVKKMDRGVRPDGFAAFIDAWFQPETHG